MSGPPLTKRTPPAITCSSGRIVCHRRTTAPGPDPVPPAAHSASFDWARWSSCRGQHRSLCQTTRRWPSPRRPLHWPRPRPRTDRGLAATPHPVPGLTPRTSLRAEQRACMRPSHSNSPAALKWLRLRIKTGSESTLGDMGSESDGAKPGRSKSRKSGGLRGETGTFLNLGGGETGTFLNLGAKPGRS